MASSKDIYCDELTKYIRDDWTWRGKIRCFFYRNAMKLLHRFNLHYAPPIYPDGEMLLWCKWCGFRQVVSRPGDKVKQPYEPNPPPILQTHSSNRSGSGRCACGGV